ncbi:MAG: L-threonylcarbamoyladenylate synthase [Chlamydiae bacterium]|nr:L-threonylcarbamoyladenylate synthase [Chlamydiota bacterium]
MSVELAAHYLKKGMLVAIPTETVYGLACNAFDEQAIRNVFQAKKRPYSDPLIVHCKDLESVRGIVSEIPPEALELAEKFWPGPLTLLLPKKKALSDLLTSGSPLIAIRIPAHPLTLELLKLLDFPLAAPSANPFGYISPTTAQHVADQLKDQVAYILDGGPCLIGIESTIIGFKRNRPEILRQGAIPEEQILGCSPKTIDYQAPGSLKSHYSPRKNLLLGDLPTLIKKYQGQKVAILSFSKTYDQPSFTLSKKGSLEEAAHYLFAALRLLDNLEVDLIIAEEVPNTGLGKAINERLHKAACHKGL